MNNKTPRPLKRFSQNYLKDNNIAEKIIQVLNPSYEDVVLEIGPGTGILTRHLIDKSSNVYAVEIDSRVILDLRENFPELNLFQADFLKFSLDRLNNLPLQKKVRIIGNLPYNISSPVLFKLIDERAKIIDAVLMLQYEVARRLTASPGTKDYGILSVILGYYSDINYCFKVPPQVFYPKPKVDSAVVQITFRDPVYGLENEELFIKIVKASFGNRRKTLKNSLRNSIFKDYDFMSLDFDFSRRAEELSIQSFVSLTNSMNGLLYAG